MDRSAFLLETDQGSVRDIRWSLVPLELKLTVFSDVNSLLDAMEEGKPRCVITRIILGENDMLGVILAEKLLASGLNVPLIATCSNREMSYVKDKSSLFSAVASFPVEFPKFTETVKAVIDGQKQEQKPDQVSTRTIKLPKNVDDAKLLFPERETNKQLDRNVLLVYQIQHLVLKELESQAAFGKLLPHQVPSIILDVTRKVCGKVSLEGVSKLQ